MQDRRDHECLQADQALRDSEALYRSLFTLAPSGVVLLDDQGRILAFNDQAHQQLGYTREEFARLGLADLHPPEKRPAVPGRLARLFEMGGGEFECRHRAKSGELRHILARSRPVEITGVRRLLCVWQDITESKRVEEDLRESEERLTLAMEAADMGTWHAAPWGPLEYSPRCREVFGLAGDAAIDGYE